MRWNVFAAFSCPITVCLDVSSSLVKDYICRNGAHCFVLIKKKKGRSFHTLTLRVFLTLGRDCFPTPPLNVPQMAQTHLKRSEVLEEVTVKLRYIYNYYDVTKRAVHRLSPVVQWVWCVRCQTRGRHGFDSQRQRIFIYNSQSLFALTEKHRFAILLLPCQCLSTRATPSMCVIIIYAQNSLVMTIYLFIYLLKAYSPVKGTESPQGFSLVQTLHSYNLTFELPGIQHGKHGHLRFKKKKKSKLIRVNPLCVLIFWGEKKSLRLIFLLRICKPVHHSLTLYRERPSRLTP